MGKIVWESSTFSTHLIRILPDLGMVINAAASSNPPSEDYDFESSPLSFIIPDHMKNPLSIGLPERREDLVWQINKSVVPLLEEWFLYEGPKKFWQHYTTYRAEYIPSKDIAIPFFAEFVFTVTAYLAMLGNVLPYSEITLELLREPRWGEVVNTAAEVGLLFIHPDRKLLPGIAKVLGNREIDFSQDWDRHRETDWMLRQSFNVLILPISYWRPILDHISALITKDDPILQPLLCYAFDEGSGPISWAILTLALRLGLYTPLTISGFLAQTEYEGDHSLAEVLVLGQAIAKSEELASGDPELVQKNSIEVGRYGAVNSEAADGILISLHDL